MTVWRGQTLIDRMAASFADSDRRLLITPLLDQSQVDKSQASVDLRLGSVFLVARSRHTALADLREGVSGTMDRVYVPLGRQFILHPNQFVLGQTLEFVHMPNDAIAYVVTRSSWGRIGLIVATAVGIQPCFRGVITLELRNLGEVPLALWPGSRILQLYFHELDGSVPRSMRSYTDSLYVEAPKMQTDGPLDRLIALERSSSSS
jgi:dCTP deaminase